jgi:hypothetical protein
LDVRRQDEVRSCRYVTDRVTPVPLTGAAHEQGMLTLWGRGYPGLRFDSSESLEARPGAEAIDRVADDSGAPRNSVTWLELWLTEYHGQPVRLGQVVGLVSKLTGLPIRLYGYWMMPDADPAP